jgi:hypothetical protein
MRLTRRHAAALAAALFATGVPLVSSRSQAATTPPGSRVVWDDFRDGFRTSGPDARWTVFGLGGFVGDDGVARTGRHGLDLAASGTNPRTGEPAFVRTVPQEPPGGGLPGTLDHVKYLALANHTASTGQSGWDTVPGQTLTCETTFGGRTYGTAGHPFGAAVADPEDDLRLAMPNFNLFDVESSVSAGYALTNRTVYALYERLPNSRGTLGNYDSFLHAVPVARRRPSDRHRMAVSYDRARSTLRWQLDGREALSVGHVGRRLASNQHLVVDHGGAPGEVTMRQANCGMGLFTVLDASGTGTRRKGLARLTTAPDFYFDTATGAPTPQPFVDERSLPGSRLFGQGAALSMRDLVVTNR